MLSQPHVIISLRFRKCIVWSIWDVPLSSYDDLFWKVKGHIFGSTGLKFLKLVRFGWKWSQHYCILNTIQKKNSLLYVRCFVTFVHVPVLTLTYLSLLPYQWNIWHKENDYFGNSIYHTNILRHLKTNWTTFMFFTPMEHKHVTFDLNSIQFNLFYSANNM